MKTVSVFGASGFVGTTIVEYLLNTGNNVVSYSRSKQPPPKNPNQTWVHADPWKPETYLDNLKNSDAVIISIGTPPVPTLTKDAFDRQVKDNGDIVATIINTSRKAGIKQVVVIGATMPQWAPKGYLTGKQIAKDAAENFARGKDHGAVVLQPAAIYGTRVEKLPGTSLHVPIPLWAAMFPASLALQASRKLQITPFLEKLAPSVFKGVLEPMVPVHQVAKAASVASTQENFQGKFTILSNQEILKFEDK